MVPIIPIMVVSLGILLKQFSFKNSFKATFVALASVGFYVNLLGVLVWYQLGYGYAWTVQKILELPLENYTYLQWHFEHIPVILHWHVLTTDFAYSITLTPEVYWNWCLPDAFLYCNYGFIAISLILIVTAIIGLVIVKTVRQDTIKQF